MACAMGTSAIAVATAWPLVARCHAVVAAAVDRSASRRGSRDPRDVFVNRVDLPRGATRERVYTLRESYTLRGSESRTVATVGAFRVVPAGDLRDNDGKPLDPNRGELHRLRREGLVDAVPYPGRDRALVVLTDRGRELLDRHRHQDPEVAWQARHERSSDACERERAPRQEFYSGIRQPRELTHDAKVYAAYLRAAERLQEQGARVRRVVVDLEIKRDYQRFLQERNRDRGDSDGRPDRTLDEIHRWAAEHQLPEQDGHVTHSPPSGRSATACSPMVLLDSTCRS
jgi:DNA-binding PadR family transcriptional regulator